MLEAKKQGSVVQEITSKKMAPVIDLMAALQRSLGQRAAAAAAAVDESDKKPAQREADNDRPARRRNAAG